MKKTRDLETLPRYVYGITAVVTVLALLLVAYLYVEGKKTFQVERRLTEFHLPTIIALNVIEHEFSEIEKNTLRTELSAALHTGEVDIQSHGGLHRDQLSAHLHLIKTRLDSIQDTQRDERSIVFKTSTGQLQAVIHRLESTLEETQGANPVEAGRIFIGTLKRAQLQVEQLSRLHLKELAKLSGELESYSYSIAHDLRAPLRTVTSFSQILQEDAADRLDSEEKQSLECVVKAGKYMARLIDDILELSRITRTRLESDRFDLSRLAQDIALRQDNACPDRRVQWRIQDGLEVTGSRLLLELSLANLFGNAWKYTEKTDPACIEFGAARQNGEIVYFVKDNGIGFDMQYADKLFKPFQRLDGAGNYAGTGVGLATVERVIQRHGGRIWAESEEGKGATFLFTLPS